MAFSTRRGQTVAVGTGAMTTGVALTVLALPLLLGPLAVSTTYLTWLVWPDARPYVESNLGQTIWIGELALSTEFLLRTGAACCGTLTFFGPRSRLRDHVRGFLRSKTAMLAAASTIVLLTLVVVLDTPIGDARSFVIILLTGGLITLDLLVFRGVRAINRSNRAQPYFEGMTALEKSAADRPWPVLRRPNFPIVESVVDADDAQRYERRAKDAAELHVWIGAGLVVVFTAFISTAFAASWENPDSTSTLGVYVVLGFAGLGFWLQRRARSYRALAEDFHARAKAIISNTSDNDASARPGRLRTWSHCVLHGRGRRVVGSRL